MSRLRHSIISTWNVDKLFVWSTLTGQISCAVTAERKAGGGGVGVGRMIQVPGNWLHWTMVSRSRATLAGWGRYHTEARSQRLSSDTKSIYKISLTLCEGKGREGGRGGGCLAFEPVCVCALVCWGRGGWGLKWERKGDSDRLKKKWRKGGGDWLGAVSPKKKKKNFA